MGTLSDEHTARTFPCDWIFHMSRQPFRPSIDSEVLAERFQHLFHRDPSPQDLQRFRYADSRIRLRMPARTRRSLATIIATI